MTFSFDAALTEPADLVRFHIGDTNDDGHFLEDETISALITSYGADEAVIQAIKFIISQLSKPNFKLDWLSVTGMEEARKGYQELLEAKKAELGVQDVTLGVTIEQAYRTDSSQDPDDTTYHTEFDDAS